MHTSVESSSHEHRQRKRRLLLFSQYRSSARGEQHGNDSYGKLRFEFGSLEDVVSRGLFS